MSTATIITLSGAIRDAILDAEDTIEALDRAIGDGDHYHNIRRGTEIVAAMADDLAPLPPDAALKAIAMKLMVTVGGASGPLIASFFLAMSRAPGAAGRWDTGTVARMVAAGVEAIRARGKAELGDKTMLDVLIPVAAALGETTPGDPRARLKQVARDGMLATRDLLPRRGRAAFLGERARGHIDPGAMTAAVIVATICDATLEPV